MRNLEQIIGAAARARGFAMVGFARIRRLTSRENFYNQWIAEGRHSTMDYLAREPERRFDPRQLDSRLRSVISLAYPYAVAPQARLDWRAEMRGRIAAYALGEDYHRHVLAAAKAIANVLEANRAGTIARVYVDTGPIFEREWASSSGLGWFGKNTMLLSRDHGSYFFLAEIFTDAELAPSDAPYRDHCGTCRRCLDACPTSALQDSYKIEPRACISYLTIEHRGPIDRHLRPKIGEWVFGCDLCNDVCPWNSSPADAIGADDGFRAMPRLADLLALDDAAFSRHFSKSAVKRAKRRGLLRNAAVVVGNTGNRDGVPVLVQTLQAEPEALVRMHAAWALGRLGGAGARAALELAMRREPEAAVVNEIEAARAEIAA